MSGVKHVPTDYPIEIKFLEGDRFFLTSMSLFFSLFRTSVVSSIRLVSFDFLVCSNKMS